MVSSIIGAYLTEKGIISSEQLKDVLYEQQKVRVKLGLIAVAEGLMTQTQADKVNRLQATIDKRFGDIAVELGFLNEGQVESLLKKQGNSYMAFAQALNDLGLMDINQLEQCLVDFKQEKNFTNSDLEALKSDDIDRILTLFMPAGAEPYYEVCGVMLRTLVRFVDRMVFLEKGYITDSVDADNAAMQLAAGSPKVTTAMSGIGNSLLELARKFGMADFDVVDEESMDAVAEFINCVNGLYVSAISLRGIELELMPPEYSTDISEVMSDKMLVLPIHIADSLVNFSVSLNGDIAMNG